MKMPRQRRNPSNTMNNQDGQAAQKENKKSPENQLKDMNICGLNDKEFKTVVLKKFSEMKENIYRQFNELRK